jgi:hypothetical protein
MRARRSAASAAIAPGRATHDSRMSRTTYSALAAITRSANGGGWARKNHGQYSSETAAAIRSNWSTVGTMLTTPSRSTTAGWSSAMR